MVITLLKNLFEFPQIDVFSLVSNFSLPPCVQAMRGLRSLPVRLRGLNDKDGNPFVLDHMQESRYESVLSDCFLQNILMSRHN